MTYKCLIFDMDGTLVDSRLDFSFLRKKLNFPENVSILDHLKMNFIGEEFDTKSRLILEYELDNCSKASAFIGVKEFLNHTKKLGIKVVILTNNAREVALKTMKHNRLQYDLLLAREDVLRPKPDPSGLLKIMSTYNFGPNECLFFGDYIYDLQAGEKAGIKTWLFTNAKKSNIGHEYTFDCYINALLEFDKLFIE